jgi:lipoprotein-anchoring transpeptidase ErfK/SrfK
MASVGITFPIQPIPATRVDLSEGKVDYSYVRLSEEANPVYASLDDAHSGANPVRVIDPGKLKFVSYTTAEPTTGNNKPHFFQLASGEWVAGGSRWSPYNRFSGLIFQQSPTTSFGWVLPFKAGVRSKRTPGLKINDYNSHKFQQYELVQIFAVQKVANMNWYLIGPDEWLDEASVGRVVINNTPPQGVTTGRWIEVNLKEQTLAVYDQDQLVFATLIATGQDGAWTRPGLFHIYKKYQSTVMSAAFALDRSDFYYLDDVPFTMYYDEARALHGAYWRAFMGYTQSHGCVNLAMADAHWLFDWAKEGDAVYVWDPSGKTPTDPSAYSGSGAP